MFKLAFFNVWRRKTRVLLIALAIVIGVAAASAVLVLRDSVTQNLASVWEAPETATPVDIQVVDDRNPFDIDNDYLDTDFLHQLVADAQIQSVVGTVENYNGIRMTTADDQRVGWNSYAQLNTAWLGDSSFNSYTVVDGRAPTGVNEVMIGQTMAASVDVVVGDTVTIQPYVIVQEPQEYTVVGLFEEGGNTLLTPFFLQTNIFSLQGIRQLLSYQNNQLFSHIKVKAVDDANLTALTERLNLNLLPDYATATVFADQQEELDFSAVSFIIGTIANILLGFIVLAMLVGMFVVSNTFNIVLTQRAKELALLRAIAFSKPNIYRLVIIEAVLIGIGAALVGIGAGIGIAATVLGFVNGNSAAGFNIDLAVSSTVFIYPLSIGVITTVVAAVMPALRASRLSPVAILSDSQRLEGASLIGRMVGGFILLGGSVLAFTVIWQQLNELETALLAVLVGVGCVAAFLGTTILMPLWVKLCTLILKAFTSFLPLSTFRLVLGNVLRQPKRIAATANTLAIGITLIVLVTALVSSFQATAKELVEAIVPADWSLEPEFDFFDNADPDASWKITPKVVEQLEALEIVADVNPVTYGWDQVFLGDAIPDPEQMANLEPENIAGIRPSAMEATLRVGLSESAVANLENGQIAVLEQLLTERNWQIGQTITFFHFDADQVVSYVIGGTFETSFAGMEYLLDNQTYSETVKRVEYDTVLFDSAPGLVDDDIEEQLQAFADSQTALNLSGQKQLLETIDTIFTNILNTFRALLSLSLVVAFLGIFNTLSLSIIERTRELGILRALGMTRTQMRRMIGLEALMIVSLGLAAGMLLGVLFAQILYRIVVNLDSIKESGVDILFSMPVGQFVLYCAIAVGVVAIAAIWPAIRAGRLNIIRAITSR